MIALDDVVAAAERLKGVANHTPILGSRTLDGQCSAEVLIKDFLGEGVTGAAVEQDLQRQGAGGVAPAGEVGRL